MVTAFGVAQDKTTGQGCDAMTHRRIIAAQWENPGIITGLKVSGRQDLRYGVSPGVAVCSMGETDGMSIAYWDGTGNQCTENTVDAADSTYSRIDAVYIISFTGVPDNQVHVRVKQGVPSASPMPPRVEAGGLVIACMLLPAGSSSTLSATREGEVDYAIPYGASLGLLGVSSNTSELEQDWTPNLWWGQAAVAFSLPTDRQVEVRFTFRANSSTGESTSCYARVRDAVNGDSILTDGWDELIMPPRYYQRQSVFWDLTLKAGQHNIVVDISPNVGGPAFWWRGLRQVEVRDRGVVR